MSEPAIIFKEVSKSYPLYHHFAGGIKHFLFHLPSAIKSLKASRHKVLEGVSFEVYKGETLGIIGRNGAGKSTMLGLIAGVLRPSTGKVAVKGRISPFLELGGGFHPELTGRENIVLNGVLLGLTRAEIKDRMSQIIEFSEIGEFIDQPIRTYSSGMLARLGFSVLVFLDSEILLVDEILAVGDKDFQKKCLDKMSEFQKRGITIVFVSHSMEDIKRICDRVIWIEDYGVKMVGEPDKITSHYLST